MRAAPLLVLTFLAFASLPALSFPSSGVCVECAAFSNAPAANIVYSVDTLGKTLSVTLYYEDPGGTPSRKPINNSVVLIELSNSTGLKEIYKTYTNDNGTATFNFAGWSDACLDMKMMYCPFCNPDSPACGFAECLSYAQIHNESGYYSNNPGPIDSASDIDAGPGAGTEPSTYNPDLYFPALKVAAYCPPPPPLTTTPAMCLPLLIIFSLLSGALYLTGRNPFVGFNIGGARVGRHIRYQARGRGFSFSAMSLVSAVQTVAGAVKSAKAGTLAKDEARAARERSPVAGFTRVAGGIRGLRATAQAAKGKGIAGFAKASGAMMGRFRDQALHGKEKPGAGTGARAGRTVAGAGGALTFEAGGASGIRGSDLAKYTETKGFLPGVGGYFTDLGANLGRVAVFVLTQTTLGRVVDGFYSLATNKSIFESAFVRQSERLAGDMEVMGWMSASRIRTVTGPDGRPHEVVDHGVRVPMGDGEVVVTNFQRREGGGFTVTFLSAAGDNAHDGQTVDGRTTVSFDSNGRVVSMSFNVMVPGPPGADGRPGAPVPARVEVGPPDVLARDPNTGREVYGDPHFTLVTGSGSTEQRVEITRADSRFDTFFGLQSNVPGAINGAMFGGNATDFLNNCRTAEQGMGAMTATVTADIAARRAEIAEQVQKELARNPETRDIIRDARYDDATRAWEAVLGADPGSMRVGAEAGSFDRVNPRSTEYGEMGRHEAAAAGVHEAFGEAFGGARSMGEFASRLVASVPEAQRGEVSAALASVLSTRSPAELAGMSNDDLRRAVASEMSRGGAPGSDAVTNATRAAATIPDSAFNDTRSAMTTFRTEVTERLGAPLAARVCGSDFGGPPGDPGAPGRGIVNLAATGGNMSDNPMAVVSLLESRPESATRLPEGTRMDMRLYENLGSMSGTVDSIGRSMDRPPEPGRPGNFESAATLYDRLDAQNHNYWEGGLAMTASRYGGFNEQETGLAMTGVDRQLEADRLARARDLTLAPPPPGAGPGDPQSSDSARAQRRWDELSQTVATGDYTTAMAGYQQLRDAYNTQLDIVQRTVPDLQRTVSSLPEGNPDRERAERDLQAARAMTTELQNAVGSCDSAIGTVRNFQNMGPQARQMSPEGYGMMMSALPGAQVGVERPLNSGVLTQGPAILENSLGYFSGRAIEDARDSAEVRFELSKPRPTGGE